jgi:uncharacterized SAM-binding protein YcdF (DUF218 family)
LWVILITTTPVVLWYTDVLAVRWPGLGPADTLIVLSGGVYEVPGEKPLPAQSTILRVSHALYEARRGGYGRIVLAGGAGGAESMAAYLRSSGLPDGVEVILETKSLTTRENALEVQKALRGLPEGGGRLVLVTSDIHSRRAAGCFRRAGLRVAVVPAPDVRKRVADWRERWSCFVLAADETVRLLYYWARGWV